MIKSKNAHKHENGYGQKIPILSNKCYRAKMLKTDIIAYGQQIPK
jgi:hypothetical protein